MPKISDKRLLDFRRLCDEKGMYEKGEEYREVAQRLVGFLSLLIEID